MSEKIKFDNKIDGANSVGITEEFEERVNKASSELVDEIDEVLRTQIPIAIHRCDPRKDIDAFNKEVQELIGEHGRRSYIGYKLQEKLGGKIICAEYFFLGMNAQQLADHINALTQHYVKIEFSKQMASEQ